MKAVISNTLRDILSDNNGKKQLWDSVSKLESNEPIPILCIKDKQYEIELIGKRLRAKNQD